MKIIKTLCTLGLERTLKFMKYNEDNTSAKECRGLTPREIMIYLKLKKYNIVTRKELKVSIKKNNYEVLYNNISFSNYFSRNEKNILREIIYKTITEEPEGITSYELIGEILGGISLVTLMILLTFTAGLAG